MMLTPVSPQMPKNPMMRKSLGVNSSFMLARAVSLSTLRSPGCACKHSSRLWRISRALRARDSLQLLVRGVHAAGGAPHLVK